MSLTRKLPRSVGLALSAWAAFVGSWFAGSSPTFRGYVAPASIHVPSSPSVPPWLSNGGRARPQPDPAQTLPTIDIGEALNESDVLLFPGDLTKDPWVQPKQKSWRLIILFQHNLPMLLQAVAGYRRASAIMAPNIIVVDNSAKKEAAHSKTLRSEIDTVVKTPRMLNFPELHNFMADIALSRKLEFYFWAHADNYVLPFSEKQDLGIDVIKCMRKQITHSPNWGMMLFAYDHLAAFRTQTIIQVPWDPLVFQYGSECDVYGRIRDAGYDAKACKVHHSYDMKQILNITDTMTWGETKAILDADAVEKHGRNQWREAAMDPIEQEWRKSMKLASREYLQSKWKVRGCKLRGLPCHKPWPFCPKCPIENPDCFNKRPSRNQLLETHAAAKSVFATHPEQPISYEEFKKDMKKASHSQKLDSVDLVSERRKKAFF